MLQSVTSRLVLLHLRTFFGSHTGRIIAYVFDVGAAKLKNALELFFGSGSITYCFRDGLLNLVIGLHRRLMRLKVFLTELSPKSIAAETSIKRVIDQHPRPHGVFRGHARLLMKGRHIGYKSAEEAILLFRHRARSCLKRFQAHTVRE